jgi:hypothetical protein
MFQFNPNNTDQSLELDIARQESDHAEEELLETEVIAAENEVHEGVSKDAKRQLQSSFEKLSDLESRQENGKLTPEEADQNILNITRSRIQNIIIRERLQQADGPVSLTRNKLLNEMKGWDWSEHDVSHRFVNQHIDDPLWAGIQSATRSAELALHYDQFNEEALSSLENRQILFNDEIDANDATDYILIGTRPAEGDSKPKHVAILVQVGTSAKYKDFKKVRNDHEILGKQLTNRISVPEDLEQVNEHARELCADFVSAIDLDLQNEASAESFRQFSNQIRILLEGILHRETKMEIKEANSFEDLAEMISNQERRDFAHSLYTLDHLTVSGDISSQVSSVFANPDRYNLGFIEEVEEENIEKLKNFTKDVIGNLAAFVQDKLDIPTPEKIPYELYSHIDLKYADKNTLPRDERTQKMTVDDPMVALYSIDTEALDTVLSKIIAHHE